MPVWMLLALLSMITLAGAEFSQKISLTSDKDLSAITNNFYIWTIQGTIGLLLAFAFGGLGATITLAMAIKLALLGILYFVGGTLYYTSYKASNVSISIILMSLSSLVSTTLGILLLNEGVSWQKYVGVAFVLVAIATVRYAKGTSWSKYNLFALLGGLVYGITFTLDKSFIVDGLHPFFYLGIMCLSVAVVSMLFGAKKIVTESKKLEVRDFYPMIMAAVFGVGFNAFTFFAYKALGSVGKIDAINNSVVFIIIAVEFFVYKQKSGLAKKGIAAALAVAGMVLFALYP